MATATTVQPVKKMCIRDSLKAMRLAISLLDSGTYDARRATNRKIRTMAVRTGIHRPSNVTCKMVRAFIDES